MNRKTRSANLHIRSYSAAVLALYISTTLGLSAPAVLAQETAPPPNTTATPEMRNYNIPVQPLSKALLQFEQQSGLQVTASSDMLEGKQATAVRGSLSAQQALSQLLAGTGLHYQISGRRVNLSVNKEGTITLSPVNVTAGSIQESAYGPVEGYVAKRSATATKTDTPIIDIPASIQVVPREVIKDQGAIRIADVLKNVGGVTSGGTSGNISESFNIRGFYSYRIAKDSFLPAPSFGNASFIGLANIERVEVLKGPASVLYGQVAPGGLINLVTKKPQPEPFYNFTARYGSYDLYRGQIDLNQPLNSSDTLLFRLNGSYLNDGSFRDYFMDSQRLLIAPSLRWVLSDRTTLDFQYQYSHQEQQFDRGLVVVNGDPLALPIDRYLGEADDNAKSKQHRGQFTLDHAFNEAWKLRLMARVSNSKSNPTQSFFNSLQSDGRTLNRTYYNFHYDIINYGAQANLTGDFRALQMDHQLLIGLIANRSKYDSTNFSGELAPIDIYNPVYGAQPFSISAPSFQNRHVYNYGLYLQDLISIHKNWKVLLGGRFDVVETFYKRNESTITDKTDQAFSPRAGLVYQPTDDLSLYASYSESFDPPLAGASAGGEAFDPTEGKQYEVGVKRYFLDGKLSTTFALFQITQKNVATADPTNPNFSIQVGEQRSRGAELNIAGELYRGWNVIGSATYLDAEITKDNTFAVGNKLPNVPHWQANLWNMYRFQSVVPGLEIGGGVFYVGARQADLGNTLEVDGYTRVDLLARYKINNNFTVSLNINNLLDKEYVLSSSNSFIVEPGAPRTAFLRVDMHL